DQVLGQRDQIVAAGSDGGIECVSGVHNVTIGWNAAADNARALQLHRIATKRPQRIGIGLFAKAAQSKLFKANMRPETEF
ncbi:hypothetical protein, partial [Yoonia sp.]|uniref:hypothetical protein n=1 Tax=Yoonia sp. TaxID=2212373 RepID=UPI0025FAC2D0